MKQDKLFKRVILSIVYLPMIIWIIAIIQGHMPLLDQYTRAFVEKIDQTILYHVARWITELGSSTFLIPFTLVMSFALWYMYKHWLPAFLFAGGTLMSHVLNQLIKGIIKRERPSIFHEAHATGYSFPSGHAMISIVCYGLLLFFLVKKLSNRSTILVAKIGFTLLVLFIGLSRFIINVHYLTDIYSGFVLGFMCLMGICRLYNYLDLRYINQSKV